MADDYAYLIDQCDVATALSVQRTFNDGSRVL